MHFPLRRIARRTPSTARPARDERGVAFPSPLVMLSVVAVAMAGIAFVATNGSEEPEREITPVAQPESSPAPEAEPAPEPEKKRKPVQRGKVMVEVYNNSGIKGLAGTTAGKLTEIGWQVVGSDNWYGTIPSSTVYFPEGRKRAAQTLARDLGIKRIAPAVDPMRLDRVTVILTQDFS